MTASRSAGIVGRFAVATLALLSTTAIRPLSGQGATAVSSLGLVETWSSDEVANLELGWVDGVVETPLGTIWISDSSIPAVISIDSKGGDPIVIARGGDGPGEIGTPDRIALTPEGNIAVFDLERGVELFAPGGDHLQRISFRVGLSWPRGFAALDGGRFVVSGGLPGVSAPLHLFDDEGRLLASWEQPPDAKGWRARMVGGGGPVHATSDGGLLYSQAAPHRIAKYSFSPESSKSPRGTLVVEMPRLLRHPGDGVVVETGEGAHLSRSFRPYFPQSTGIFQRDDGSVVNVIRYKDDGRSVWQVFRDNEPGRARLVGEARAETAYVPWHLTADGDFLASRTDPATDVPTVVRLRLTDRRN